MRIKITNLIFTVALLLFISIGLNAQAAGTSIEGLNVTQDAAGISELSNADGPDAGLGAMAGRAINVIFGLFGVVFVTVILIGGYIWMAATGNEESIKKAKTIILNGIFGLMVIFVSYALVLLILSALQAAQRQKF
jgi:hypothetical protein|tara:strand:+ start:1706 stop:2113 length:408 start_codon:yes stop_codon:yes gene_type:complete